jgi:hypothetical protein
MALMSLATDDSRVKTRVFCCISDSTSNSAALSRIHYKCKRKQILHTAVPCSFHSRWRDSFSFVLNRPTPFRFVVVCLFLFDCMYLINVAILYKYQLCVPRTIYPVVLFHPSALPSLSLDLSRLRSLSLSLALCSTLYSLSLPTPPSAPRNRIYSARQAVSSLCPTCEDHHVLPTHNSTSSTVTATSVVGNAHSSSHSSSKNPHAHWPSELYADFTSRVWITYWHIAPASTYPGLVTYCLRARIGRILHSFDGRGPKSRSPPVLHQDVGGRVGTTAMRIEGCRLGLHALNRTVVALDGPTPGTRCVRFFPNTIPCPDLAVDWQLTERVLRRKWPHRDCCQVRARGCIYT